MSEFEVVCRWANNLFQGYELTRQPTNTELVAAFLSLAKGSMELEDRLNALEAENADLKNQLREAMAHDDNSLSAFLNDAIEYASHRP